MTSPAQAPTAGTTAPGTAGATGPGAGTAGPPMNMMQQMMSNPALMSMMMNPAMNPFAGGAGGYAAGAPLAPGAAAQTPELQRARFASQLTQLSAMGFTNEAACLRALAQHEGRVDAAIDTLLSDGNNP